MTYEAGTAIGALIKCEICGNEFYYEFKNPSQECPMCGQKNYKVNILSAYPETFRREK